MASALFAAIIAPLINVLFDQTTGSKGVAVVGLSFVVTLCMLPLYMVAERWQEEERLRPGMKRI